MVRVSKFTVLALVVGELGCLALPRHEVYFKRPLNNSQVESGWAFVVDVCVTSEKNGVDLDDCEICLSGLGAGESCHPATQANSDPDNAYCRRGLQADAHDEPGQVSLRAVVRRPGAAGTAGEVLTSGSTQFEVVFGDQLTSDFVAKHQIPRAASTKDELDIAVRAVTVSGLFLEFGVFKGRTITQIANLRPDSTVHGFDSFRGLAETWRPGFDAGAFDLHGQLPAVPSNVQLVPGWFNVTAPQFARSNSEPIAFLHVDCDTYESTALVLNELGCRLQPGSVIEFDEYFSYEGWKEGEHRAWMEAVDRLGLQFKYLAYCGMQATAVIHSIERPCTAGRQAVQVGERAEVSVVPASKVLKAECADLLSPMLTSACGSDNTHLARACGLWAHVGAMFTQPQTPRAPEQGLELSDALSLTELGLSLLVATGLTQTLTLPLANQQQQLVNAAACVCERALRIERRNQHAAFCAARARLILGHLGRGGHAIAAQHFSTLSKALFPVPGWVAAARDNETSFRLNFTGDIMYTPPTRTGEICFRTTCSPLSVFRSLQDARSPSLTPSSCSMMCSSWNCSCLEACSSQSPILSSLRGRWTQLWSKQRAETAGCPVVSNWRTQISFQCCIICTGQ
jgi:hypothetical protein